MYTIAKNVQIVIALLKEHGINQLVLSPGGTNAAFVRGVQDDPFFQCYSVVDERSALYFAIGIYLSTGKIVAVCCTSAQATRNYIPGLTEAFYKHAPILAITFSKHPRFTYQDYMQAPDQTSLPHDAVRATYALPYISNEQDILYCQRLVNEAILELTHQESAPVQLNVPMLDTELTQDIDISLPNVKVIRRHYINELTSSNLKEKRILIVVGENLGLDDGHIINFAKKSNTVIYVNHLSNMRNDYTVFGNRLLSSISQNDFDEMLCPDILITIGGQTGDYPLFHKLSGSKKNYEHWRISPKGNIVDTYDHLTHVFECKYDDFFMSFKDGEVNREYLTTWQMAINDLNTPTDLPLSAAYVAQQLNDKIPEGSFVNFSILNSLRTWDLFPIKHKVHCFCNVGAFGIDGCLSTFLGQSVSVDNLCFMFIGDLSFFYDMNSLGIRHIRNNVRIILINNNGGIEFKLGGDAGKNRLIDKYIAAANHFKNSEGWAVVNGFDYISINTKEDFIKISNMLVSESNKPILCEVFTTDIDEANAYKAMTRLKDSRNFQKKAKDALVNRIKKIF